MLNNNLLFFFIISVSKLYIVDSSSNLSQYVNVCHRRDPQLSTCIKDSLEKLRPFLKTGVPELSIPALEPLVIPEIEINQGKGSAVNLQAIYRDLHLWGTSQFELGDFHVDMDNNRMKFQIHFPRLITRAWYNINGRILMLPLIGNGLKEGNYTNVRGNVEIQGGRIRKKDGIHFHIDSVFIDLDIQHVSVHFSNLFNGDTELGDAMNIFINENWKHIIKDMRPVLEQTIGEVVKDLFNAIYSKLTMDEILPW